MKPTIYVHKQMEQGRQYEVWQISQYWSTVSKTHVTTAKYYLGKLAHFKQTSAMKRDKISR